MWYSSGVYTTNEQAVSMSVNKLIAEFSLFCFAFACYAQAFVEIIVLRKKQITQFYLVFWLGIS